MRTVRMAAACCIAVALSSCEAPKPEVYILGRWEDKDHTTLQFQRDGAVAGHIRYGKSIIPLNGNYRFLDEQTLEIESVSPLIAKNLTTYKVNRLDYRELSLSAPNGVMTMWTRPAN